MFQVKILNGEQEENVFAQSGQRLIDVLLGKIEAPCGGRGSCGKCRVEVLREGSWHTQLACGLEVTQNLTVRIPQQMERKKIELANVRRAGIAVDLGTTTIAMYLVDLADGQIKGVLSEENSQKAYGADVISRIDFAGRQGTDQLQKAVCGQLQSMMRRLNRKPPERVVIAGNTVMSHLLLGKDPSGLASYPFVSRFLEGQQCQAGQLGWDGDYDIFVMPSVSAYIGGDLTASILACGMHRTGQTELLIDLGTNGEMILAHQGRLYGTSVAVGPAFEGSHIACGAAGIPGAIDHVRLNHGAVEVTTIEQKSSIGICGNGLVETVSALLEQEILQADGKFREKLFQKPGWRKYIQGSGKEMLFRLTPQVFVTQQDIRQLQYAKAAVAAGLQVLLQKTEGAAVDTVYLAGGFGSYLSREDAVKIGLLPEALAGQILAAGNTSGKGAVQVLCQPELFEEAGRLREKVTVLELGGNPEFEKLYVSCMNF